MSKDKSFSISKSYNAVSVYPEVAHTGGGTYAPVVALNVASPNGHGSVRLTIEEVKELIDLLTQVAKKSTKQTKRVQSGKESWF